MTTRRNRAVTARYIARYSGHRSVRPSVRPIRPESLNEIVYGESRAALGLVETFR